MEEKVPFEIALEKLKTHFSQVPDPRVNRNKCHPLENILVIAFSAVLCGADDFTEIAQFGRHKRSFFERFLDLSNGIPSHDTFGDVFKIIDTEAFAEFFTDWVRACFDIPEGSTINIDGKTVRGSHSRGKGIAALHLVSAWASNVGISFAQREVDGKSNEIAAIPYLLAQINLENMMVTIDSMGCQTEIAQQITGANGDYLLAVKLNQPTLYEEVLLQFGVRPAEDTHETIEKDHGRIETRRVSVIYDLEWMDQEVMAKWPKLASIVMVQAKRELYNKTEENTRLYISSKKLSAIQAASLVRSHWSIENNLHWCLDVAFAEDKSQVRERTAVANLAIIHKMALNILKSDTSVKVGIKAKRKTAGWDEHYLAKLLIATLCKN